MDIGMREILILLGCLIMAVLCLDAYRRVRDHRRSQLGHRLADRPVTSKKTTLDGFDDDELEDDLLRDDLTPVRTPEQSSTVIGAGHLGRSHASQKPETPAVTTKTGSSQGTPSQIRVRISTPKANADKKQPLKKNRIKEDLWPDLHSKGSDAPMKALLQPALATAPQAGDFYSNRRRSAASVSARKAQAQQEPMEPLESKNEKASQPEEVIVMHVAAGLDSLFDGEILVQHLLALNMRHGEMNIFHRYERPEQHLGLLFSLANMVKPGYFELDHMNAFETPGVTFFLTLPCQGGGLYAYDLMVDTARKLSKVLDGELRDETQSVMTPQTVEHYRQKVMEFERKQRMMEKTRQIRERSKIID